MCQIQDGAETIPKLVTSFGKICMRCEEDAVIALKSRDLAFCRSCFLNYFTHKFRSTIGKSKLVKKGEKILLAFSGGQCSSALLQLVKEGLGEELHKRLRFHVGVIYIDEGAVTNRSNAERMTICDNIKSILKTYDFPSHIATLEQVFNIERSSGDEASIPNDTVGAGNASGDNVNIERSSGHEPSIPNVVGAGNVSGDNVNTIADEVNSLTIDDVLTKRLQDMLANITSITAKEDLVHPLRNKLLVDIARHHRYDKIMFGDSGTTLSVAILADIAKGRGASIPLDTNFADHRYGDIICIRPMREFMSKEIGIYNHFHGISPVVITTLTTKGRVNASINKLTEAFVTGLQADFPSTVNTVFRTGEKLCVAESSGHNALQYCILCQTLLDTVVGKTSALNSTQFSLDLMQRKRREELPDDGCSSRGEECCGQGDGSCHSNKKGSSLTLDQLNIYLCYACRVTVRDMMETDTLPEYIIEEARRRTRRTQMKTEIEDFLLDDDES